MVALLNALPRPGPVARLSFGLVSLMASLVLALDLFFNVLPTRFATERQLRDALAGAIGVHVATLLERNDRTAVEGAFAKTMDRERSLLSLALRRSDGRLAVQTQRHEEVWSAPAEGRSTLNHVRLPLYADGRPWGDLEISFTPLDPMSIRQWLREPLAVLLLAFGSAGLLLVFLYMRRALEFLDPASAVPQRVRLAFDALVDGVVIVDSKGRIVLANQAFRSLAPEGSEGVPHGRPLASLQWLMGQRTTPPWIEAMRTGQSASGLAWDTPQPNGSRGRSLLGCAPVTSHAGQVRGCLITLHDVTGLQRSNEQLRSAMNDLKQARAEVEAKNEELMMLATRDPLTGCLNRRAFFDKIERIHAELRATGRPLGCVMVDIDHFKSINDRFGHGVGDQVIQAVGSALMKQLRPDEILCRYGGEEFCIVVPDVDAGQTRAIAERLRESIEANVGRGIRTTDGLHVTASLGVAGRKANEIELAALIDAADGALYEAKRSGRNRVEVAA